MKKLLAELNYFIRQNQIIFNSLIISVDFIFLYMLFDNHSLGNNFKSFGYDISVAIVASIIFYIFQIYIPSLHKRIALKKFINNSLLAARFKILSSIFGVLKDVNHKDKIDKLVNNMIEFSNYFLEKIEFLDGNLLL